MPIPHFPPPRIRAFSRRTIRIGLIAGFVAVAATLLVATNSSARALAQTLFADAAAIISGATEAKVAPANHSLEPQSPEPAAQSASSTMTSERRGHTATRLSDGRVLITGGDNAGGGYLSEAEIFDPVSGTFEVVGSMAVGRSDHAAVKLADGKVLIIGGRTAVGVTNATEVFDPATGTFAPGPATSVARAGHSATLFADGRVFVAGGDANGTAEIFDSGSFSAIAGNLAAGRAKHSAALLLDGRVLIVGGRDTTGTDLSSLEVFDPAAQSFSSAGDLAVARVLPHLRVLFDGKVQIIGGNNDESMEIYDPVTRDLGAYAHVLPATDTCAGLRPAILGSQTRAALFHNGQSDALLDRSGHTINELPGSNQALVAGGANSSGIVLSSTSVLASSPSSITTDKLDYAPGETVKFSGRSWQPGETVRVVIHEDPHTHSERNFEVQADAAGSISGSYQVEAHDLNVRFIVGAKGQSSGWTAQTTFTDANNDAHIAPEWAPGNTTVTFNTLYRVTTGTTVQSVRITLPAGYTGISAVATAFSSGTWGTPVINQTARTVEVAMTSGTALAVGTGWARIDIQATTPASLSGNGANWLLQTFTNSNFTGPGQGTQSDNPPVLVNDNTNPTAAITFVDAGGNPIANPVLQNGLAATVRVRITQTGSGIKYVDVAVPTCFSSPSSVTTTVSTGGNGGYVPVVTDGFIRMPSGQIPTNGFLDVQFTTTPNCVSGTYFVTSSPSTNATNPPATTNQSVAMTGGSLTVAAGRADLSITKTDSPDPVAIGGTLTYTIGISNAGPDPASAVKVVDTLPAGVTFVSATGTDWNCANASGTVTCNRTAGNLPVGPAPNITIVVTAPATAGSITNTATVSSPNDDTPNNNTATATTTVTAANNAPAGTDNTVTTNEDVAHTFTTAQFGFTDPNDTPPNALLAVKITTLPADGKLKLNGVDVTAGQLISAADITAGNLKFFPDAGENGSPYTTFTFQVQDDGGTAAGGVDLDPTPNTMTINVASVNDEPAGTDNTVTTNEDTAYTFAAADFGFTDPNDTPANALAAVTITTVATNGKLKLNGVDVTAGQSVSVSDISTGKLKFFPDANENGTPYATFTFQVQDDGGTANGGVDLDQSANTMTVNVNSVNDEPAGADNSVTTNEDTAYTFAAAEFGFTDPNDTPANTLSTVKITTVATNGKLQLNGVDVTPGQTILVADINAGNLKFLPDANENGSPYATFTFQVQDDGGIANGGVDLDQSPNTMTINVTAVNDTPDAVDDAATVNEDSMNNAIDVLANDTDPDNLSGPANAGLTVTAVTQPAHGSAAFTATGVTYTPAPNYFGPDSFTYTISDGDGATDTATVNITVTNINDTPDAVDDAATVNEDSMNNAIDVLANDTDPDNLSGPANAGLTVTAVTQPSHGSAAFTATGVTYTPAPNYFGPDSFTYTISDGDGATDTATVNITVTNINDAPVMNNLNIAPGLIDENDTAILNGSFSDADSGDSHTVVISWGDGSPNTTINLAAGVFTFNAPHQYKDDNPTNTASDVNSVMVTVCDGGQDGSEATSADNACAGQSTAITVRNLPPVITSAEGATTPQPAGTSVTVTANFTDAGTQDTHTCSVNWDDGTTSNGTVTEVNGSGTCTASHTYANPGVYSVVITVTDDDTGSTSRGIDSQFLVIFDPNSGFVTGGGWIMSPAGACQFTPECATLTGRANFGFVSKYKKGSNTPDGQTEFQFKAGDINFHSSAYDYGSLVVSGFKAQYKGTGEINGVPGYKFVLTAYDGNINGGGGVDKFRIKITKNGIVVYDNRVGASDDVDLADPIAIAGGSIVIHK